MRNRGVSLYIAIVIMAILLAIVLGISAILVGQIKMIREMENSVIAFYAADTGIEWILQYREDPREFPIGNRPANSCTESNPCPLGQAEYYVEAEASGWNCTANNFCIRSVGVYKETTRAIEVSY